MKASVSLSDEQYAYARILMGTGRHSSVSAVLRQGLDLLRGRVEGEELERAALRDLLASRREGEFVPADGMDRRLSRVIAAKRRSHELPS